MRTRCLGIFTSHPWVSMPQLASQCILTHQPEFQRLSEVILAASRRHSRGSWALAYPSSNALSINEARAKEAHHCKRGREAPAKATIIQISPFFSEEGKRRL